MSVNTPNAPILEPRHPPESPQSYSPEPLLPPSSLTLLQLNAHRSEAVLQNVLHAQQHHILLIQEPWISKYNMLPVTHPSWHLIMPMGHNPTSPEDRAKTCIYISKTAPTRTFTPVPTESALLTAVDIDDPAAGLWLQVVSWYNPPTSFCGLPVLTQWLD